jgi:hypothetical protein
MCAGMRLIFLLTLINIFPQLPAQGLEKKILISFVPTFNDLPLELNRTYFWPGEKDTLIITRLRFYISNIRLIGTDNKIYIDKKARLIDLEKTGSEKFQITVPEMNIDAIFFDVGLDSLTNVSGAMGGDLDPTNGMYWAWHSGYINFKMEGKSTLCENEAKNFHLHLGGYQPPFKAIRTISGKVSSNSEIMVKFDLSLFLSSVDLKTTSNVMSPGKPAVRLSELLSKSVTIK